MDTVHLESCEVRVPSWLRLVILPLFALGAVLGWSFNDLWRVATWPRVQFDIDDSLPRHKLLLLALFGLAILVTIATIAVVAHVFGWSWFEWGAPIFVCAFLYSVATGIRLL